ncbi:glutamate-rich protein 6 [Phyllopteryx taeniolatus]|uniref:glutamate-rich protein 6 n=1 Tax=Phyllopteryx taeniolatus TaxID=161469 RepID=UPI002AD31A18|nr:glutamate-rich protein 6 [Phyllopteryx taeniolatus]XP_061653591.1 glutamate-rich protein 6 [Phyllopteryx taeniolatus]XP_061653592.1 glutamate-rich protein 6 [Phyllopteryx taeniolatus]
MTSDCSLPRKKNKQKKMRSSFSKNAVAKLEHDICELLRDLNNYAFCDTPTHCIRAGVLSYHRESDNPRLAITAAHLEAPFEYPGKCEYCHRNARPVLDVRWEDELEAVPGFCCAQRKMLCMALVRKRPSVEAELEEESVRPKDKPSDLAEALLSGREKKNTKNFTDLSRGLMELADLKRDDDASQKAEPTQETKILSFRLAGSAEEGGWTLKNVPENVVQLKTEEARESICDHKPPLFGICHFKDGEFQQKFYMDGKPFLNMFPDGSAQLFYPGELLALVFVITKDKEKVCIVYDNNHVTPHGAIRAIFQSNGKATCYHSNGNIWLSLNRAGGQCLDEMGARIRRWSWKTLPPPHLPPLFLSLNKNVGVRVLGKDQIFVSFLANGQQARCSVGSCSAQCKCTRQMPTSGPSLLKDELFVLAARVKIHLCIQHLNWSLLTPLHQKSTPPPSIRVFGKKLLEISTNVLMSQHERAFIRGCLQDCL